MHESKYSSATCACGKPIPKHTGRGRPRKHCGPDCNALSRTPKPVAYKRLDAGSFACVQCGVAFDAARPRMYCGSVCKERAKTLRLNPNARQIGPMPRIQTRACKACGKPFKPVKSKYGTFCTRECAFKVQSAEFFAARTRVGPQCSVYFTTCSQCGKWWTARAKNALLCSDACRKAVANAAAREYNMAATGAKDQKTCKCCGTAFTPVYGDKRNAYCSGRCARRMHSKQYGKGARKRARRFGAEYEPVNRVRVFNRDGWRCQICSKRTPRSLMGSLAPNAPELDHRVPISKGGPHTYANVQCACRACNGTKSNRSQVGQLPLFSA